jgi:predicted RNA-binding protein with TRAM domain
MTTKTTSKNDWTPWRIQDAPAREEGWMSLMGFVLIIMGFVMSLGEYVQAAIEAGDLDPKLTFAANGSGFATAAGFVGLGLFLTIAAGMSGLRRRIVALEAANGAPSDPPPR